MIKAGYSTPMLRVRDVIRSILFYESALEFGPIVKAKEELDRRIAKTTATLRRATRVQACAR